LTQAPGDKNKTVNSRGTRLQTATRAIYFPNLGAKIREKRPDYFSKQLVLTETHVEGALGKKFNTK